MYSLRSAEYTRPFPLPFLSHRPSVLKERGAGEVPAAAAPRVRGPGVLVVAVVLCALRALRAWRAAKYDDCDIFAAHTHAQSHTHTRTKKHRKPDRIFWIFKDMRYGMWGLLVAVNCPVVLHTHKMAKMRWQGPPRGAPLNPTPRGGVHRLLGRNNCFVTTFLGRLL